MNSAEVNPSTDALTDLHQALDALAAEGQSTNTVHALGDRAISLQFARQKLDGVITTTVGEATRAGVAANAGHRTMAHYLAATTHMCPDIARADARLGTWVWNFAHIEAAMLSGELSRHHADLLRRSQNIRVFAAMQRDQEMLANMANDLEWKSYKNAVKYWLLVNDPDGSEPKDLIAQNTCNARLLPNGQLRITATLDPVSGAIVNEQLQGETSRLFREDQETDVTRGASHRRADALVGLIARGAGRNGVAAVPLVTLVMSKIVADHAMAQLANGEEVDTSKLAYGDIDGRCELIDGTPIHPKFALILLAQAKMHRQVMSAKSRTLDLGENVRSYPGHLRQALLVEARGQCKAAGCDAPFRWLEGDHTQAHSNGGQTSLENGDALCSPDNKFKAAGAPLPEKTTVRRPPQRTVPKTNKA